MPCYHPVPAFQAGPGAPLKLWPPIGSATLAIPCGACVGCRSARAAMWARRCMHEASLYQSNCFITLTYSDKCLPARGALEPRALVLFLKRLRAFQGAQGMDSDGKRGIRYFACGEYGERGGRPHYHALLFNCWFKDVLPHGKDLFTSPLLRKLWPDGNSSVGRVSGASANYVAQYSLKKAEWKRCDADGVVMPSPFLRMSLKPAIGSGWLARYKKDLVHGYLVHDGQKSGVPRTYVERLASRRDRLLLLQRKDPDAVTVQELEEARRDGLLADEIRWRMYAERPQGEATSSERLLAGEEIHLARAKLNDVHSL